MTASLQLCAAACPQAWGMQMRQRRANAAV